MHPLADAPLVSRYTRAQAIEDGVLVDVSELARTVGFRFPVAVGSAAFATVTGFESGADAGQVTQAVRTLLRDLVSAIRRSAGNTDMILFETSGVRGGAQVALKSLVGPGDNAEPVITILFPNED